MKQLILALGLPLSLLVATQATAIEIIEPEINAFEAITISSRDDQVSTLGEVSFIVDFSATHDDLFSLSIRRKNLRLQDDREVEVFAYDKGAGIIVAAAAPVSHISISGRNGAEISALFHNANNQVIAPAPADIGVFDLSFNPLDIAYAPTLPPSAMNMDVTILIDRSGSMLDAMPSVLSATRDFMANLPDWTQCHIFTFGSDVERLTSSDPDQLSPCPQSLWVLNQPIAVGGSTALFEAINQGLAINAGHSALPNLVIVLTDGVNTQKATFTKAELISKKQILKSKVLTFWAGSYSPTHLQGIADYESVSTLNVKADLDKFLQTIGISISGIQTLTIK